MTDPLVYIVDDDPDMLDSLAWLMKTVGLWTKTFPSAAGFLRDFTPNGPGCVLLDVRMPGLDGPGDSIAIEGAKHKTISMKVTAPAGTTLYFFCAVHPWMHGKLKVT